MSSNSQEPDFDLQIEVQKRMNEQRKKDEDEC